MTTSASTPTNSDIVYDVIIMGGGIAGLYSAHQLIKKFPKKSILILERENVLGGRIKTYTDKRMTVEAGAGRCHQKQIDTMSLITELGLAKHMFKIKSGDIYYDIHTKIPIDNPNKPLLEKLVTNSVLVEPNNLKNMSLVKYASMVLSNDEIKTIEDTFGYYTELVTMNASDCISLIREHLSPKNTFYILQGGLKQIIDKLEENLQTHKNVTFLNKHQVSNIQKTTQYAQQDAKRLPIYKVSFNHREITYLGKQIISALPKQVLEKMDYFKPIHRILHKSIHCGPLCRIYSVFPLKNGKAWFDNIPKFTTNNNLRIVIPISSEHGVIMSSYTDNKYSKFWKDLYKKGGEHLLQKELVKLLKESTGIENIPPPIKTEIFYWDCGVGYWTVGTDSQEISTRINQPFPGEQIFICGEHFSHKDQQWIEGALETSKTVVSKIF